MHNGKMRKIRRHISSMYGDVVIRLGLNKRTVCRLRKYSHTSET